MFLVCCTRNQVTKEKKNCVFIYLQKTSQGETMSVPYVAMLMSLFWKFSCWFVTSWWKLSLFDNAVWLKNVNKCTFLQLSQSVDLLEAAVLSWHVLIETCSAFCKITSMSDQFVCIYWMHQVAAGQFADKIKMLQNAVWQNYVSTDLPLKCNCSKLIDCALNFLLTGWILQTNQLHKKTIVHQSTTVPSKPLFHIESANSRQKSNITVYYYHFFFIKLFPMSLEKDDSDTDLDLTDGACCSETVTVCVHDGRPVTVTVSGGDAKIQNAAFCASRGKILQKYIYMYI